MALPFILAGFLGKAAASAVAKGLAGKASAAGAKALVGSHGHHGLAQKLAREAADKLTESALDAALEKKERKDKRDQG
jgi:hypothetical protein